ncbi:MAG: hypothetical protein UV80_C0007G0031 [Candidatus Peregrinibacteria bacterium GW2011_GWF2_43_17]|nr:MAG: hypothetical protein UV80_C0007G0031 [Candidatus Peregrinibacteria bacterium GW2011_GWF2_43_17]KKT18673.1 MAG: hypothetical protein UW03_C0034G0002 [Candidatus Peregrinibacteria bacterium GW2011_GWA2_43_8]HAU39571.1 hypothetical protein [Candidatus Peregrinibacteria bacterium]
MFFKEKRLVWDTQLETGPVRLETTSEKEDDPDEGAKTTPEESAQKKSEAQTAAETESMDASKQADELARTTEQTTSPTPETESPEQEEPTQAYKWLESTVGKSLAKIIAVVAGLFGLKIFGNEDTTARKAADKLVEKNKTEYQAVIIELIGQKKLPDKVIISDTDPAVLATDYDIKTPDDLKAFFQDKTPLHITEETDIIDYMEMIAKQAAGTTTAPATPQAPVEKADTSSPFDSKPPSEIDLSAPNACGRFKLKTGEELRITKYYMEIGGKKFKVEVKFGFCIDLQFNKITPSTEGFLIGIEAGMKKENIPFDESKMAQLIQGLYQKKSLSSFEQTALNKKGEEHTFLFTAIA